MPTWAPARRGIWTAATAACRFRRRTETQTGGAWYAGTADAITQNLDYIKANDPKYVLILSGDHLYRMGLPQDAQDAH